MTDYQFYLTEIAPHGHPDFLDKYLTCPSLLRLQQIGYFCGMDHASRAIYSFPEYISRFDHSLSTALLTARFTSDPATILAALFHDIATPCFSHAIDFMNHGYEKQESTEEYTEKLLRDDPQLNQYLVADGLTLAEVSDFKRYGLVDTERPRLCADRLDGLILSGIGWTEDLPRETIHALVTNATLYQNEDGSAEIGFKTRAVAKQALAAARSLDAACSDHEDIYMMSLLARIVRHAIEHGHIAYDDLYRHGEADLLALLHAQADPELDRLLHEFATIQPSDIPPRPLVKIKSRELNPLAAGQRLL